MPVVGDCIHIKRQGMSIFSLLERGSRDSLVALLKLFDTLLRILVPEIEGTVRSRRGECVILRVEAEAVHWENEAFCVATRLGLFTMAAEREVFRLVIEVLNPDTPLDAPNGEAHAVGENANCAHLVHQRRGKGVTLRWLARS